MDEVQGARGEGARPLLQAAGKPQKLRSVGGAKVQEALALYGVGTTTGSSSTSVTTWAWPSGTGLPGSGGAGGSDAIFTTVLVFVAFMTALVALCTVLWRCAGRHYARVLA